uniref:Sodium-coupled monocarboxylate transporter 1 n=1 Tax=Macrostomum lignano TaxID=282301 RepID=A0A1I8IGS6_9PLAT
MHPIDYVVIVLMCLASVGIGVFTSCTGGRQRSTSEYMMGNRQMNLLPVAISILVSFWSAISLLGGPAEIFYFGSYFNVTAVGITLACLICAYLFVPLFYPLQIISIFEYLELRYQAKFIRYWGTGLYVLTSWLNWLQQWLWMLGGIKAVIWSDVFQSVFILIGLVAALIKATIDSGGPATVFETNSAWGRFETFNWSLDPRVRLTVWGSSIGVMLTWIPCYGPNQASFQRFASLPTLAKAKWSILLNIFGVYFFFALLAFVGYALFALYTVRGCDPFSDDAVSSINQLLPHYIKYDLNIPTLPGIIMACILSGAFSTTSTLLNSQAAVTVIDFVQPRWRLSDAAATVATKW